MTKSQRTGLSAECTVGSAFSRARDGFARAGVESPHLTAELLLGHVLGWNRTRVLTHPEAAMPAGSAETLEALVRRRCSGEPLQYILGEQEFLGLSFRVTPDVLIPRPETEILVEKTLSLARGRSRDRQGAGGFSSDILRIVDIGTGSGCIAVSVAHELPASRVWAVDVSLAALAVARENVNRHRVSGRVHLICADMMEGIRPDSEFDFVLSNPPYVADREIAALPPEVREHEPMLALFGGAHGLDAYARLAAQAGRHLVREGYLLAEIGAGQAEGVTRILQRSGLTVDTIVEDLAGIPRCVVARP